MLSIVILTKNSQKSIEQTIQSCVWADECIIIDDFSNDQTRDVAKKYSVTVYQHALNNDFAKQRNFGMQKAKGEWILFVDSDEIISEELKNEIQQVVELGEGTSNVHGYYLKRDDIFLGGKLRFGETANVRLVRLGRKGAGEWKRPVHEYWDIKEPLQTLENPLIHTAHYDYGQFLSKINWYSTINAEYLYGTHVRSNLGSILIYPTAKFLRNYFVLQGFRDGTRGMIMAISMSLHSFLTRAKLFLLHHEKKHS